MQKKYDRPTRHTATLRRLYNNPHRRLPQAFAHKPNKEKRKRKESQLPLCASTHSTVASRLSCLAPLVPLVPLKHVRLSATCASQQRALLASTPTDSSAFSLSLRLRPLGHQLPPLSPSLKHFTCASQHVLSQNSLQVLRSAFSLSLRPALFWARCIRVRQSGEDTPPLPLPLLASETGR